MPVMIPQLWSLCNHQCGSAFHYRDSMKSGMLALAHNVRMLREHKGWSIVELAKRAGVSKSAVGYLISYKDCNDRHPTMETVDAVAAAFGLESWQLMLPNTPLELLTSRRLSSLIQNYSASPEEGRRNVERVAESEKRYAMTTQDPDKRKAG